MENTRSKFIKVLLNGEVVVVEVPKKNKTRPSVQDIRRKQKLERLHQNAEMKLLEKQARMRSNYRKNYMALCREIHSRMYSDLGMNEFANIVRESSDGITDYQTTIQKLNALEANYTYKNDYNFDEIRAKVTKPVNPFD
jgi:hypothetical protein